jgi:uncharacterized protein
MFSTPLLRFEVRGGLLEPAYLDGRYTDLVRTLVLHHEAHAGRRLRDLDRSLDGLPEAAPHDPRLVAGLRRVIEESMTLEHGAPDDPRRLREAVFVEAEAAPELDRAAAFRAAAGKLGLPRLDASHLYADLAGERIVRFSRPIPPAAEIISRYNFRLLQGLILHAASLRVTADGEARAIYRAAKLQGLIVEARLDGKEGPGLDLEITGPLSLFFLTRKYGLALARFLPACAVANRFRLEAKVAIRGLWAHLEVTGSDRVLSPHRPPRLFDSKLEERFLRDFLRLDSRWTVTREERLIPLGSTVFIPDFTFRLRADPSTAVDLEIVGFWTRDYLARKRSLIAGLRGSRTIFCVDDKLRCGEEGCRIPCIPFSRRVPAERVLETLEKIAGGDE